MLVRPINRQKYPYTVRFTESEWGVLNTKADPPCIECVFATEEEAWAEALMRNKQYWLGLEAERAAYWAIQKAADSAREATYVSPLLRKVAQAVLWVKRILGLTQSKKRNATNQGNNHVCH